VTKKFNLAITIAQLGISFTAVFSYPLQTFEILNFFETLRFACRNALNLLFFPGKEFSYVRHYIMGILLVVFSLVSKLKFQLKFKVSNVIPKIGVVFGFIGAFAGIFLMYVIPSLMYLKLVIFADRKFSFRNVIQSILPGIMVVVGTFLAIVCTITVVYSEAKTWFQ
jgi:hypothetical protein